MSSSSSSSSSSQPSSASITPYDVASSSNVVPDIPGPSTSHQSEAPSSSSSRQRAMNEVWLEPVVEALATQVAIDASHYHGRLAAASALAIIFQVTFSSSSFYFIFLNQLTKFVKNC